MAKGDRWSDDPDIKVREMRNAETVLGVISERGRRRPWLSEEHSIAVGSRGNPRGDRKCLPLKMVPASRLVIRTQQQNGFRTFLVPVDTRPLQPQVHHSADRTLDRTTADRHLQRREPRVIPPTLLTIPLEVCTLPFQRLARARATACVDRRWHRDDLSLQKTSPLATNPRRTLRSRPAPLHGRDLAQ